MSIPSLTEEELYNIAEDIEIDSIRRVGFRLGYNDAAIRRFEHANMTRPSGFQGTADMLTKWFSKGGTREQLCGHLRDSKLVRLAKRVEDGKYVIQTAREDEAVLPQSESNDATATQRGRVSSQVNLEGVLPSIANEIPLQEVERLGLALGFTNAETNRYAESNLQGARVTIKGTKDMLFSWRANVKPEEQKDRLRAVLISVGQLVIANKYLPLG
ncbi:uncharacterized protein [Diadema antillarum]|uniref:uncharacterized protein n=1 Tax=Diadema antillarum TaxID=105358 RepID=UPI003A861E9E